MRELFNAISFRIILQHVGSTSIAELHTKPILDTCIILEEKRCLEGVSAWFENYICQLFTSFPLFRLPSPDQL